jgi:hypothetical protein
MTDHPGTFKGNTAASGEVAWDDRAAILPAKQAGEFAGGGVPLMRGTFAEMIHRIALLTEQDRAGYVIEKAGDRTYSAAEAMALASRPDFPAQEP